MLLTPQIEQLFSNLTDSVTFTVSEIPMLFILILDTLYTYQIYNFSIKLKEHILIFNTSYGFLYVAKIFCLNNVYSFFQTNEDIGDLYQDEENQAAILLRNEGSDIVLVSIVYSL